MYIYMYIYIYRRVAKWEKGERTPLPSRIKQIQFALNRKHAFFDAMS